MTTIKPTAKLTRETAAYYRGRALVIELYPGYCSIRMKGTRQVVSVDYRTVLETGYKVLARQAAAEKAARKKRGSKK
jgi:hypothetical protein